MPDIQIGRFGISNNPETDIGKNALDFLGNKVSQIFGI